MTKQNLNEEKTWDDLSKEAKEIVLHADNDRHMYKSSHEPIMHNLAKKLKQGIYDIEQAKKLWGYHADRAAMSLHKEAGDPEKKWHQCYGTKCRKEAAGHFESFNRDNLTDYDKKQSKKISEAFSMGNGFSLRNNGQEESNQEKAKYFSMLDNVIKQKPLEFNNTFKEVLLGKLRTEIENMKDGMRQNIFNPPEEVTEKVVNEVSNELLGRYIKKSSDDMANKRQHLNLNYIKKNGPDAQSMPYLNRKKGIERAVDKMTGKAKVRSNAIHASIHPDDTTGHEPDDDFYIDKKSGKKKYV